MSDTVVEKPFEEIKTDDPIDTSIEDSLSSFTETPEFDKIKDETSPPTNVGATKNKRKRRTKKEILEETQLENTEATAVNMINGALFIFFIDTALPMAMALINNKFSDEKISAQSLKLNSSQKKELEPLADEVAKQIAIAASPVTVLATSLIGIYASNLVVAKMS